jgi:hypothetical protein
MPAADAAPLTATVAVSLAVFGLVGFLISQGVPAGALWVTLLVVGANRRLLRARGLDIVLTSTPPTIPNARARRTTSPVQAARRSRWSGDAHPCLSPGLS